MKDPRRWYIEARVGSENHRGDLVHFIYDGRGRDDRYDNEPAEDVLAAAFAALAAAEERAREAERKENALRGAYEARGREIAEARAAAIEEAIREVNQTPDVGGGVGKSPFTPDVANTRALIVERLRALAAPSKKVTP